MVDYREIYYDLFRSTTQAIEILQQAQKDAEEAFISAGEPSPSLRLIVDEKSPDDSSKKKKRTGYRKQSMHKG